MSCHEFEEAAHGDVEQERPAAGVQVEEVHHQHVTYEPGLMRPSWRRLPQKVCDTGPVINCSGFWTACESENYAALSASSCRLVERATSTVSSRSIISTGLVPSKSLTRS